MTYESITYECTIFSNDVHGNVRIPYGNGNADIDDGYLIIIDNNHHVPITNGELIEVVIEDNDDDQYVGDGVDDVEVDVEVDDAIEDAIEDVFGGENGHPDINGDVQIQLRNEIMREMLLLTLCLGLCAIIICIHQNLRIMYLDNLSQNYIRTKFSYLPM